MKRRVHRRRRSWLERARRTLLGLFYRIVRLDDSPRSIALGTSVGLLIGMTPTYGVQMILVVLANTWLKVNRLAGIVAVHITNPITALPAYWFDYKVGVHVLGQTAITQETFKAKLDAVASASFLDALSGILHLGGEILGPLVLGSLIVGSVFGIVSYPVTLVMVRGYKEKRALRRARKKLRRRAARRRKEEAETESAKAEGDGGGRDIPIHPEESGGNGSDRRAAARDLPESRPGGRLE